MVKPARTTSTLKECRRSLLQWYEQNRRDLPWRRTRDPYAIWVSEIMLQQTRVAVVIDRYRDFMARFPTIAALAAAPEQEVLALWSGLGYYRRARMLQKAAQVVAGNTNGDLPETASGLRALPGIGEYTSAAIASIAFGEAVPVIDGNVERVVCRLEGWNADNPKGVTTLRRKIEQTAYRLLDPERPGDFNQAMMELGATVCLPRNPQCLLCPLKGRCKTQGEHKTARRAPAVVREAGCALCVRTARSSQEREVLLEQRPDSVSVMPGLWELPSFRGTVFSARDSRITVRHAIMNVNYIVRVFDVHENNVAAETVVAGQRHWIPLERTATLALTGLARKILRRAHLLPTTAVVSALP